MSAKKVLFVIFLLTFGLLNADNALAQLGTSGINGRVVDSTGAVISGATVIITNQATGQTRETTSSENGAFLVQNLNPSLYDIKVQCAGFQEVRIFGAQTRVGDTLNVLCTLKPEASQEVVQVNGNDVTGVDTLTSQVSATISDAAVANLPLNGRNFLDLAFLLPGNTPGPNFDPTKDNTIEVSSAGQAGRIGNISIDGGDNNDDTIGGTLQNFPQDAVREFQIITNRFSAEIGRSASSAINIVTKSGSNDYHGSAGLFYRDKSLSALPATLDRTIIEQSGKPPFSREQYAASLGGPIVKDKAWFFGAFEYRHQNAITLTGFRDTTDDVIKNDFASAPLRDTLLTTRADWQVSLKDRMAFRYGFETEDQVEKVLGISPTSFDTANHRQHSFNRYNSFVYDYLHTFSARLLNDFVFEESHFSDRIPAFNDLPELIFPSIADGGNFQLPQSIHQNRVQFRDTLSLVTNKHNVKFGAEFHYVRADESLALFQAGALFLDEDFASQDRNRDGVINDLDIPIDFVIQGVTTDPFIPYRNKYFGVFVQDDWKVRRNFTVNAGLRYDLDTEANNQTVFDRLLPFLKPFAGSGGRGIDKKNFSPRIGFNWDIFGDGKTSFHGGYGIYYNHVVFNVLDLERRGSIAPRNLFANARDGSVLDDNGNFMAGTPTLANPYTGPIEAQNLAGFFVLNNQLKHPYVQQFNLGFKREITKDLVLSVDGIHTFGTRFFAIRPVGEVFDPAVNGPGAVLSVDPSYKNWYDALLVNVEKRASKHFSFIASYTLSKGLNYVNDDSYPLGFSPQIDPDNNLRLEKGPTVDDQRHRFSFAGNFSLPYGVNFSPIFIITSGVPFDILLPDGSSRIPYLQRNAGGNQFHTGAELNAFIQQINAGGGINGELLPFVRNDLQLGQRFTTFDMRLSKVFKINERFNFEAIMEAFNLFNVTNIRGFNNLSYSGFQNVLVRDSDDPNDPGFMKSSTFGNKVQTAGGVFGSGGPRAFQFAIRVNF